MNHDDVTVGNAGGCFAESLIDASANQFKQLKEEVIELETRLDGVDLNLESMQNRSLTQDKASGSLDARITATETDIEVQPGSPPPALRCCGAFHYVTLRCVTLRCGAPRPRPTSRRRAARGGRVHIRRCDSSSRLVGWLVQKTPPPHLTRRRAVILSTSSSSPRRMAQALRTEDLPKLTENLEEQRTTATSNMKTVHDQLGGHEGQLEGLSASLAKVEQEVYNTIPPKMSEQDMIIAALKDGLSGACVVGGRRRRRSTIDDRRSSRSSRSSIVDRRSSRSSRSSIVDRRSSIDDRRRRVTRTSRRRRRRKTRRSRCGFVVTTTTALVGGRTTPSSRDCAAGRSLSNRAVGGCWWVCVCVCRHEAPPGGGARRGERPHHGARGDEQEGHRDAQAEAGHAHRGDLVARVEPRGDQAPGSCAGSRVLVCVCAGVCAGARRFCVAFVLGRVGSR